jgi:hypothetical protein
MTVKSGLLKLTEHGANIMSKELIAFYVLMGIFVVGLFGGMTYDSHLKHECRMEALKALTDVSRINEICK